MPEEIVSYFEKKYSELKEESKTYGDLEKLIKRTANEAGYNNPGWGTFVHIRLMAMLRKEWSGLPITR